MTPHACKPPPRWQRGRVRAAELHNRFDGESRGIVCRGGGGRVRQPARHRLRPPRRVRCRGGSERQREALLTAAHVDTALRGVLQTGGDMAQLATLIMARMSRSQRAHRMRPSAATSGWRRRLGWGSERWWRERRRPCAGAKGGGRWHPPSLSDRGTGSLAPDLTERRHSQGGSRRRPQLLSSWRRLSAPRATVRCAGAHPYRVAERAVRLVVAARRVRGGRPAAESAGCRAVHQANPRNA